MSVVWTFTMLIIPLSRQKYVKYSRKSWLKLAKVWLNWWYRFFDENSIIDTDTLKWREKKIVCTFLLEFCFWLTFQVFWIKVKYVDDRLYKYLFVFCVFVFDIRLALVWYLNNTFIKMTSLCPFFKRVTKTHTHTDITP